MISILKIVMYMYVILVSYTLSAISELKCKMSQACLVDDVTWYPSLMFLAHTGLKLSISSLSIMRLFFVQLTVFNLISEGNSKFNPLTVEFL